MPSLWKVALAREMHRTIKLLKEKKEKKSKSMESDGSLFFNLAQSHIHAHAHAHVQIPHFFHISIPGFFFPVKFLQRISSEHDIT